MAGHGDMTTETTATPAVVKPARERNQLSLAELARGIKDKSKKTLAKIPGHQTKN